MLLDVLEFESRKTLTELQIDDLVKLGCVTTYSICLSPSLVSASQGAALSICLSTDTALHCIADTSY